MTYKTQVKNLTFCSLQIPKLEKGRYQEKGVEQQKQEKRKKEDEGIYYEAEDDCAQITRVITQKSMKCLHNLFFFCGMLLCFWLRERGEKEEKDGI